jgi:hypothetical protein
LGALLATLVGCTSRVADDDPQVVGAVHAATAVATMPAAGGVRRAPQVVFEPKESPAPVENAAEPSPPAPDPTPQTSAGAMPGAPKPYRAAYQCPNPRCLYLSHAPVKPGDFIPAHNVCPQCGTQTAYVPK